MKKLFLIRTLTVFIPFLLCAFTGCEDTKDETPKDEEIMPYNARIGLGGDIRYREDFFEGREALW